MDTPDSVPKVLQGAENPKEFTFGLKISWFCLAEHAWPKENWVFVAFHTLIYDPSCSVHTRVNSHNNKSMVRFSGQLSNQFRSIIIETYQDRCRSYQVLNLLLGISGTVIKVKLLVSSTCEKGQQLSDEGESFDPFLPYTHCAKEASDISDWVGFRPFKYLVG